MMKRIFFLLVVLNLFDALATFFGLRLNLIEEANPVMSSLYQRDPYLFLMVKGMFSIMLIFLILYRKPIRSLLVRYLSFAALAGYCMIAGIHMMWIFHYLA